MEICTLFNPYGSIVKACCQGIYPNANALDSFLYRVYFLYKESSNVYGFLSSVNNHLYTSKNFLSKEEGTKSFNDSWNPSPIPIPTLIPPCPRPSPRSPIPSLCPDNTLLRIGLSSCHWYIFIGVTCHQQRRLPFFSKLPPIKS
jgi:hypothetical protein